MTTYTSKQIPLIRYSTTNSPRVFVGPKPALFLNVKIDMAPVRINMPIDELRNSQTDCLVPSSYSWKPTKPLINRQVHSAEVNPFCTAAK